MCGDTSPRTPVGFRDFCTQVWASPCTAAQERTGRTKTNLSSCAAIFGIRPCAKRRPPKLVGANAPGVHAPSLRSHVSEWLGAPAMKMKMQFRAVPWSAGAEAASRRGGFKTSAKYEPTIAVPATRKRRRRDRPSPRQGNEPPRVQASQISLWDGIGGLPSVEGELELVEEGPLEILGLRPERPALELRERARLLGGTGRARERCDAAGEVASDGRIRGRVVFASFMRARACSADVSEERGFVSRLPRRNVFRNAL